MDDYERDFHVARLRAGYTMVDNVKVHIPNPSIEYDAVMFANQSVKDIDALTEAEMLVFLMETGQWSPAEENELQNVTPKHIEYWKVELFNNYFNSSKRELMRRYLVEASTHLSSLLTKRNIFEMYTVEGLKNYAKNMYIFSKTCFYDGLPVDWSVNDITYLMSRYFQSVLNGKQLRELAKTSPWNGLWSIYKKSGKSIFVNDYLSVEQQQLIQWSSLYDNIVESPECPSEDIIEDDDALDGWLILQGRNRKRNQTESTMKTSNSSFGKHAENYLVASSKEDAERIISMNDPLSMATMKSRLRQVESKGIVKEGDLADVKQGIIMKANNASMRR